MYNDRLKLTLLTKWKVTPYTLLILDSFDLASSIIKAFDTAVSNSIDMKQGWVQPNLVIYSSEYVKEKIEKYAQMEFL